MRELSLDRKERIIKTIFLSAFFHTAILGIIVFSFPISKGQPKPFFIFLGSILPKQDFTISRGSSTRTVTHIQLSSQILMGPKQSLYPAQIPKPSFPKNIAGQIKIPLKMKAFPADDQPEDKNNSEMIEKSLGIKSEIPPYAPLKLHTK